MWVLKNNFTSNMYVCSVPLEGCSSVPSLSSWAAAGAWPVVASVYKIQVSDVHVCSSSMSFGDVTGHTSSGSTIFSVTITPSSSHSSGNGSQSWKQSATSKFKWHHSGIPNWYDSARRKCCKSWSKLLATIDIVFKDLTSWGRKIQLHCRGYNLAL